MSKALTLICLAAALAACQSTTPTASSAPNSTLTNAGFVAKRGTTPDQMALIAGLPPNQFVRHTVKGKVTYLYADPAGCNCLHVGNQQAYQNVDPMQKTVYDMNRVEFGGGLDPDNIGDLSSWQPF